MSAPPPAASIIDATHSNDTSSGAVASSSSSSSTVAVTMASPGTKRANPKRNSTNSVWVMRTLSVGHPEMSELVKAMGLWTSAILNRIKDNKNERPKYPQKAFSIFLDENPQDGEELPSVDDFTYFIGSIVSVGELAPQSCIMAVAYIHRIKGKLHIHAHNWRRVLLSALILGCKVWEEHPVFNTDFGDLFPEMSGKLLGLLEKALLNLLRFEVGLTGAEYAQHYFELRDLSPKAFAAEQPLTDAEVRRLETRSADSRQWAAAAKPKAQTTQSANYASVIKQRGGVVVESGTSNVKSASKTVGRWTAASAVPPEPEPDSHEFSDNEAADDDDSDDDRQQQVDDDDDSTEGDDDGRRTPE